MFYQNQTFAIHPVDQPCGQNNTTTSDNPTHDLQHKISSFIKQNFPKQKYAELVFSTLNNHHVINDDLYFESFNIHMADFCSFINYKFCKKIDPKFLKLCKYLQKLNIKLPKVSIHNPLARKFLC